jgi:hypothetical protein
MGSGFARGDDECSDRSEIEMDSARHVRRECDIDNRIAQRGGGQRRAISDRRERSSALTHPLRGNPAEAVASVGNAVPDSAAAVRAHPLLILDLRAVIAR